MKKMDTRACHKIIAEFFQSLALTVPLCLKFALVISFGIPKSAETAFPPFNHDQWAVRSAFIAGFRCSLIPIRGPIQLAEVETGAN
ncbi:MAG: hypothetical protein RBT36_11060, partial [Desulfobulbus sp.]|nr:hypothetical protein [Desulfobulbus sp.]